MLRYCAFQFVDLFSNSHPPLRAHIAEQFGDTQHIGRATALVANYVAVQRPMTIAEQRPKKSRDLAAERSFSHVTLLGRKRDEGFKLFKASQWDDSDSNFIY